MARWWGPEGFTTPSLEFNPESSARSIRPPASRIRSYGRTQIPTMSTDALAKLEQLISEA